MWWSLTQTEDAFGAAPLPGGGLVFSEAAKGRLLSTVPQRGPSPVAVIGEGWTTPRAVVGHPDGSLLVADGNGAVWRMDPQDANPDAAAPVATGLGNLEQMAMPASGRAIYVLAGPRRSLAPSLRPGSRPAPSPTLSGPTPALPWPADRTRLVRIHPRNGSATTVSRNLADARGLAVDGGGATAYVTERGPGRLVAVDLRTGARSVVATGLDRPGRCAWIDEARGLLAAVEEGNGALAVVDSSSGAVRRVPGCPGNPVTPALIGDLLVVAAGRSVSAVVAGDVLPDRVVLVPPADPIYRGGYARVPVDLGDSGVPFDELRFAIAEGPEHAAVSPSKDEKFDPDNPHVMLLAGPIPGAYTLEARDPAGGLLAQVPFGVTDRWAHADGPPMAFTGANPLYAGGGAWGSLFNGVWPLGFTYGPNAVSGRRRVALVFVNTADTALPAGTDALYRDALIDGVAGADGVRRSVRSYYEEVSLGRLAIELAGEATVELPETWDDYTRQFSPTDARFATEDALIAEAMWRAQEDIDFTRVDTAVFVVASPNGGQPPLPGAPRRFTWPIARGGTYQLSLFWWKSLPWTVMPAEWEAVDSRRAFETLSHEIGHTIGMTDLYDDPDAARDIGGWDLMSSESALPALSLPHRQMLGWLDSGWLRTYNFLAENPVDEEVVLRASELLAGAQPAGQFAGLVVEVAAGWRYYFEYRSRQNVVAGADPGPAQVADQGMPADRRVLGVDAHAGWYRPPVSRKPIRLLGDDGDGEGVALAPGEDYEELDATANATFRLEVLGADDDEATVRVRYEPVPAPEPPWPNGPDPSIRPWPGGDNWRSPDIRVENGLDFPFLWAGHTNTIVATVANSGSADATDVKVGFWLKDFTVSDAGPETFLGWATGDVAAGATAEFSVSWVPPVPPSVAPGPLAVVHYCVVVRIAPHAQGAPPRGEIDPHNNEAQSNYTIVWTQAASPFSRQRVPVQIANPFPDRPVDVRLHAEQRLDWYRTYLEHTSLRLGPGQAREVEVMVECVAEEPAFRDRVPADRLYGEPNIVSAIAAVADANSDAPQPIGGATIEVRAGRAAEFAALDVGRRNAFGRVNLVADGSAPPEGGEVVVATRASAPGGEVRYRTTLDRDGVFDVATPGFAALPGPLEVDLIYLGGGEAGPATARATVP